MKDELIKDFISIYPESLEGEIVAYFSPGRVNLIGEHIDYNGGFVFPCALDMGTYMLIQKRDDQIVNFSSLNMTQKIQINLEDGVPFDKDHNWANYPKGVINHFINKEVKLQGMDILFYGNIPNGSGLSSSASLEVVTAYALNDLFNGGFNLKELVLLAQKVEREYMGVNCGIMDQFAVGFGKQDAAILLDCDTLEYKYAPLSLGEYKIVICNSNKKRGLADSKYNERRSECESALENLKEVVNISHLCDLTTEQFENHKDVIENPVNLNRAKHAVYENDRVKEAVKVLNQNNIEKFGQLMIQSHNSLRDLYEVSCEELDILVEEALKIDGTIGARMTGAGFGGCTVNIVKDSDIEDFITSVSKNYYERTGLKGEIYIANVGNGVRKI